MELAFCKNFKDKKPCRIRSNRRKMGGTKKEEIVLHMKDEPEFIYNCREKKKEENRAYTRLVVYNMILIY